MSEQIETATAIKVFSKKVWIESDYAGRKHIMIQHDDGQSKPFCYCTFNYDYAYTNNSAIRAEAEAMAESLGAEQPIEYRERHLGPTTQ